MRIRRSYFSLVEVLIAIAVLGLVASVVGINLRKALKQERFHASVDEVVDRLNIAQQLMLVHHQDLQVTFDKAPRSLWECTLRSDCKFPPALEQFLLPRGVLEEVDAIAVFDGKGFETEASLHFTPLARHPPKAYLRISSAGLDQTRYIALPGYVTVIKSQKTMPEFAEEGDLTRESEALFPWRELYEN